MIICSTGRRYHALPNVAICVTQLVDPPPETAAASLLDGAGLGGDDISPASAAAWSRRRGSVALTDQPTKSGLIS